VVTPSVPRGAACASTREARRPRGRHWHERTPAVAAGRADHRRTARELLTYPVPVAQGWPSADMGAGAAGRITTVRSGATPMVWARLSWVKPGWHVPRNPRARPA